MTPYPVKAPKKLIEVALPLDAINVAAAREKSIRHGHPSTLHLWWARRPLAAARAVIFGQLVNDPSWKWELEHPGETPPGNLKGSWAASRKRLFSIIEELVKWENTTNETVLEKARAEIRKSWRETCELNKDHPQAAELFDPEKLPALHDPFAGGGTIPLEAQRLGLEAYASDLNPVAVLINKAMIEIPPRFAGSAPVGPLPEGGPGRDLGLAREWPGATGLAEDVRRYGAWMREEARKRIGHLYPPVEVTAEMARDRPDLKTLVGKKLTVIAWLWARTVKSPNPAFRHVDVPLASTFVLSTKEGKEAYVQPVVEGDGYRFTVRVGKAPEGAKAGTKLARGANFRCLMSGAPIAADYIRSEAKAGRMGERIMAVVADGNNGRVYLPPQESMEVIARSAVPAWKPELKVTTPCHDVDRLPMYGMPTWGDAFTARQLTALTTFSDLVIEAWEKIRHDAVVAGMPDDGQTLDEGGTSATAHADAVAVYLALAVSKQTIFLVTQARWRSGEDKSAPAFGRQAISMVWDFVDLNPFAGAGGDFLGIIDGVQKVVRSCPSATAGYSSQVDAQRQGLSANKLVATDPPYYDNVGYADLSDFFYVWLRRTLQSVFPGLFSTIAVPKAEELVAAAYRHGGMKEAEVFFLDGMTTAMRGLAHEAHPGAPIAIYYAFKQSDTQAATGTNSTGWETFLEAVIRAGLAISGTWPMRTENGTRLGRMLTNALASSIVLVCRSRPVDTPTTSRRAFLRELNQVLPEALDEMTRGSGDDRSPVAPVDMSQAIIGPGMAVFSKYSAVLEADGTPMSVKTALQLINRFLTEGDFDAGTQFCLHWFEQYAWKDGKFGDAETLSKAKGISVDGVKHSGAINASGGLVRLLRWADYPPDGSPEGHDRLPVWELLHRLIRAFKTDGERGAGQLLATARAKAEAVRQLAYRLYTLCERAGHAEDARAYNELITSWPAIEAEASKAERGQEQLGLPEA